MSLDIHHHDDVIKWKHLPHYWPFVQRIHRSPVNSPHKGQWRGGLMFSLICVQINGWVNNGEAGDLRCHCAHYDVIVMIRFHPMPSLKSLRWHLRFICVMSCHNETQNWEFVIYLYGQVLQNLLGALEISHGKGPGPSGKYIYQEPWIHIALWCPYEHDEHFWKNISVYIKMSRLHSTYFLSCIFNRIESIKTTSMENVSTGILEKIMNNI